MRIRGRYVVALLLILVIGTGLVLWSVPLNRPILSSSDIDPPLYPDFLSASFVVTEADTGIHDPQVVVAVDLDTDDEYKDFRIQFFLLNYTLEQFEQVSNISTLVDDPHLIARFGFTVDPPTIEYPLPNVSCAYVWVLWVEADSIPQTWTLDVVLTLEFSIL